jgi:hypothetical protein
MTTSSNPMRRQHICTSVAWAGEWSQLPCRTQTLGSRANATSKHIFRNR